MRVRKKKNLAGRTERVSQMMIEEPRRMKGRWASLSGGRPVHLEIGCGKGRFAIETAKSEPDVFIVAIEMEPNVLVVAMENAAAAGVENLRFLSLDAATLDSCFASGEVACIYLNFSDPWPHSPARRLTSERFLASYRRVLWEEGELRFKTDNRALFEWSVQELERCGWRTQRLSRDIHGAEPLDGGVCTEYEERFMALGTPINYIAVLPPEGKPQETLALVPTEESAVIAELSLRVWRARFTPLRGRLDTAALIEKRRSVAAVEQLIREGNRFELFTIDGISAGMIATKKEEHSLLLEEYCVEQRFRGRGFGWMLLHRAERLALLAGADKILAVCPADDEKGLRIADALGFRRGETRDSDVLLEKTLPAGRWKYLLLDADNTLFDFDGAEHDAIGMVMRSAGLSDAEENRRLYSEINLSYWKKLERGEIGGEELRVARFRTLVETLGSEADPEELNRRYSDALVPCSRLFPGARELVETLGQTAVVAIITNGIPVIQRGRMARSGIAHLIDGFFISGELGASKPDPAYFDAVCAALGVEDRSKVLVVGDSLTSDIAGARNAGIPCCLYDPKGKHSPEDADFYVQSYEELIGLVCGG